MSKGSGSSRRSGAGGSGSSSSVGTSFTRAESIPTYNAKQTKEALEKTEATLKAIVDGGGLGGDGWSIRAQLINRNTAFEVLGRDADRPEAKEIINKLKMDRRPASNLQEGDVVSDGTSVYTVQRVNKDGSVRAAHTSYERVPSRGFSSGYMMKPYAETIKFNKNDMVTRFGNGGAAMDYQNFYNDHVRRLRERR